MTVVYYKLKDALMLGVWFYIWFTTRKKPIIIPEIKNLNNQFLIAMLLTIWMLCGNFIIFYLSYAKEVEIVKSISYLINIILMTPFIVLVVLVTKESLLSIGLSSNQKPGIPVYIYVILIILLNIILSKFDLLKFNLWGLKYFLINVIWGTAITEELLFRGFIQTRLEAKLGTNKGFIIAAFIFAFAHLPKIIFVKYHYYGTFVIPIQYFATLLFHSFIWCDIFRRTRNLPSLILLHLIRDIKPLCMVR